MTRTCNFNIESLKIRESIRKKVDLIYISTDSIGACAQFSGFYANTSYYAYSVYPVHNLYFSPNTERLVR